MTQLFKSKIITLAALIAVSVQVKAQDTIADTLRLTLEQALEIALSESNTIKIANMTVEKSDYALKGAYAGLYPNINASGSFQRTLKKQVMVMDMGGSPMEIKVGRRTGAKGSAYQPIQRSAMNV